MSTHHSIKIPAHYNIYNGDTGRELRIDFCVPDNGVDESTGLVVFVPGFGGHIDSNVYKKMRNTFPDQFNLVTIQCDYFGSRFMQNANRMTIKNQRLLHEHFAPNEVALINNDWPGFLQLLSDRNIVFPVFAVMDESMTEFNDMGFMQAIDIITAVEAVKIILSENQLRFNTNRVIGYGHSHGAYLLHLSNVLAPHLFSFLIDNSAWLEPQYLSTNRFLYAQVGQSTLAVEFEYLARKLIKNKRALNLRSLYNGNVPNKTQILTFQGNDDHLVNHVDKMRFMESIDHSNFILVTEHDIENKKFRSNKHGLDADFLELFSSSMDFERKGIKDLVSEHRPRYSIDSQGVNIEVDYTHNLPLFHVHFK